MASGLEQFESPQQFESRKQDHIRLSLDESNQAEGQNGLGEVELIHEALPDINFAEIRTENASIGLKSKLPFLISSMTAGHTGGEAINLRLARVAQKRGWLMGVGSQRRQLQDPTAAEEWREIRRQAPSAQLLGNLGITQLIEFGSDPVQKLVESLEACAMIIHTNPLQECLQPEGTPNFSGALKALEKLCRDLPVPVVLKETGCGFSKASVERLKGSGIAAVDVSGYGGTHWGRIEGNRAQPGSLKSQAAQSFRGWGLSTRESLLSAIEAKPNFEVWASGGVRSGVDAAKLLSMGAATVGFAQPLLAASLISDVAIDLVMERLEFELKTAMFCTGCSSLADLRLKKVWQWKQSRKN